MVSFLLLYDSCFTSGFSSRIRSPKLISGLSWSFWKEFVVFLIALYEDVLFCLGIADTFASRFSSFSLSLIRPTPYLVLSLFSLFMLRTSFR